MASEPKLRIASDLSLPLDTVTDTIGILAIKGGGKTYAFLVLVEEMVRQGLPVVVLDPVGVTWGLRSIADGKGPGLPIAVVGGAHGDVPLREDAGAALADWIIRERKPVVLDLSELPTKAASIRFALDFLSRLYAAADRRPIHVVLDEADDFAPQKPFGEETRLQRRPASGGPLARRHRHPHGLLSVERAKSHIEGDPTRLRATSAGLAALGPVDPLPTGGALFDYWCRNAGGLCERKILETLAARGGLARSSVARIAGYQPTSGSFASGLARLRKLRLIEGKNKIQLSAALASAIGTVSS